MKLSAIVAMTPDRIIGKNGTLPWHLPEDLKFFKKQTSGHPIVMGRKTFDSIGKPLPKRQNIILTNDQNWQHPNTKTIHHPDQLSTLQLLDSTIYVIGGSQIYSLFLPLLDDLYITHIHHPYEGDTVFPEYSELFPKSEHILSTEDFKVRRHFK